MSHFDRQPVAQLSLPDSKESPDSVFKGAAHFASVCTGDQRARYRSPASVESVLEHAIGELAEHNRHLAGCHTERGCNQQRAGAGQASDATCDAHALDRADARLQRARLHTLDTCAQNTRIELRALPGGRRGKFEREPIRHYASALRGDALSHPNASSRGVFLSYASQDATAAQRIADALRQAGIEVWLDQSELRGGEAWDSSIRRQIKACRLFVAVISANTQAREEGYFRREWNLAVGRTLDMADDTAFLLPVVIDATGDADARVPEKFREVQWTRLPGGDTSPAFVERVRALVGAAVALAAVMPAASVPQVERIIRGPIAASPAPARPAVGRRARL